MFSTIERILLSILGFITGMIGSWVWTIYESSYCPWFEVTGTYIIINMIVGGIVVAFVINKITKK